MNQGKAVFFIFLPQRPGSARETVTGFTFILVRQSMVLPMQPDSLPNGECINQKRYGGKMVEGGLARKGCGVGVFIVRMCCSALLN